MMKGLYNIYINKSILYYLLNKSILHRASMAGKYLQAVIYVSVVILIYQGIANTNLGIISQFTHQKGNNWAGPLSTALLFMGSGVGSLYVKYIGKYLFKFCFFLGSFGYTAFISLGLLFMSLGFTISTEISILVISFVAGLICSVFYNTQFNYINILSKIDNRQVQYFGINMGLVQGSNIFGNLLSYLLIEPLGQFKYVLVMDIVIGVTSLLFLFVKQPETSEVETIMNLGSTNNVSDSLKSEQQIETVKQIKRPPLKACSAFAFSGIIIGFIYCIFSIIVYQTFQSDMSEAELNQLTFVLFIFEGIGELLGGLAVILLSKRIKDLPKFIILANTLFIISVAVIFIGSFVKSKFCMGLGFFLTGIADCSCFSLALTLAGNWNERGYTAFNIFQTAAVAATSILVVFVPQWISLVWISLFYLWNLASMILIKKQKSNFIASQETL